MKNFKKLKIMTLAAVAVALCTLALSACGWIVSDWGEWELTVAPTCVLQGQETRVSLSDSSRVQNRLVPVDTDEHDWSEWELSAGVESRRCLRDGCGFIETRRPFDLPRFTAVSAGSAHSLAIDEYGNLWAWGDNSSGQLGDGTTHGRNAPVKVNKDYRMNNAKIVYIAAGTMGSFAIDADGNLWAWGDNQEGRLGDGTAMQRLAPVKVNTDGRMNNSAVVSVASGWHHSLAIDKYGNLWAWGSNLEGRLGNGTTGTWDDYSPEPVKINTDGRMNNAAAVSISVGSDHSLVIDEYGNLWTWGRNMHFQLGIGQDICCHGLINRPRNAPVLVNYDGRMNNASAVAVSAGNTFSLAIDEYGNLWSWGMNFNGQIGDGSFCSVETNSVWTRQIPVIVNYGGRMNNARAAAVSASFKSLSIDEYGKLWAWGPNSLGQLGDGTAVNRGSPVLVNLGDRTGSVKITAVVTGGMHTLALDEDGNIWVWGSNSSGQLGDGTNTDRRMPAFR